MAKMCKGCGAWAEDNDKFCQQCGSRLPEEEATVVAEAEPEIVEAEVIAPVRRFDSPAADAREVRERLIGTKTEYYLPRFEKMETLNSFTSWNWPAFFVGCWWMLYRKMYVLGGVMWLVNELAALLAIPGLSLLAGIGTGVFGNYLYMKDVDHRTEKAMDMQPDEREVFIQKNSGTGWTGIVAAIAASVIVSMLFS